jgi:hypothetical protein
MDITSDITYRGLLLTGAAGDAGEPIEGFRITRARYGDVSVHGYTEKRSLDDGMDASDVFLGARQVLLQGEVYAKSKAALFDALDILRLTFTPTDAYNESPRTRGYLPLAFSQPTTHLVHWSTGVIPRVLHCRPTAQPDHDIQFAAMNDADPDGGFVVPFVLRLEAKDPRFYGATDIESFLGSGTGSSPTVRNRGNYPAPANLVLSTTATGAKTFTLIGLGTNMEVTIPAGTGTRTVVVDGYAKVVTLTIGTTETLRMDLIKFNAGTTWPKVLPTPEGTPNLQFTWTFAGGGLVTGSRLFFRETWA